jgi:hypothetical protein
MIFSGAAESFKTLHPAGRDQAWEIFLKQEKSGSTLCEKHSRFIPQPID